ncbi:DUF285 domain-containing protein [Flavobacterium agricola]|uniref:DUF285 domain-containing protein n=1 Tax=Flavobacterium agricola TaxID=2870839 RepID=A0ABY6M1S9_9FLAO|nr:BspA family leucine-rich repeat surface protein [Flavobacterium agricola]UYW01752.1 DUF285 domain-containing protein [Flavobacterium agricola]
MSNHPTPKNKPFIMLWKIGAKKTLVLETENDYAYVIQPENSNEIITQATGNDGKTEITFPDSGIYKLLIYSTQIFKVKHLGNVDPDNQFLDVLQWGDIKWHPVLSFLFFDLQDFKISATDAPHFSEDTSLKGMFKNATHFNSNISHWNVNQVTDMSYMFYNAKSFNQNISNWDVFNTISVSHMFYGATNFNQDLTNWNLGSAIHKDAIFNTPEQSITCLGAENLKNHGMSNTLKIILAAAAVLGLLGYYFFT